MDAPRRVEFVLPVGIGDISWVYSKIRHLPSTYNLHPVLYTPGEAPRRSQEFVALLPDVEWGGYVETSSGAVMTSHIPPQWPATWGWRPITDFGRVHVTANCHLELGRRLEEWWPWLPTDYHYPIRTSPVTLGRPIVGIHLSERELCGNVFWHIWTDAEWVAFIQGLYDALGGPQLMFIGASYDEARIVRVVEQLSVKAPTYWIGKPLAQTIDVLRQLRYFVGYHDGLSVLANVVRTPTLTLMQAHLGGLCESYADPQDIASGAWKAMLTPSVEDALTWVRQAGKEHIDL